jgi:hypothetical protein
MRQRIVIFVVGATVSLGFHPVRGDGPAVMDDGNPAPLRLVLIDDLRMPPLCGPQMDATISASGRPDFPAAPFNPTSRPREYSFTELLLNENADSLVNDWEPDTELALALALHDSGLLHRLLEKGCNPNTPLPKPAPAEIVRLFDNDYLARVLAKDSRVTPLMLAVLSGQTEAVRLLLKNGASTQIHTRGFHMYPLDFAAELKSIPMMQLILGVEPTRDNQGRHVVVSLSKQKGWFLQDGGLVLETPVSTGRAGFATRPGEYVVTQKYPVWKSTLYKVPMPDFMRLNCGQTGLHGGVVPGVPASHGCIRLPKEMAAALYNIIQPGDRVSVVE